MGWSDIRLHLGNRFDTHRRSYQEDIRNENHLESWYIKPQKRTDWSHIHPRPYTTGILEMYIQSSSTFIYFTYTKYLNCCENLLKYHLGILKEKYFLEEFVIVIKVVIKNLQEVLLFLKRLGPKLYENNMRYAEKLLSSSTYVLINFDLFRKVYHIAPYCLHRK